MNVCTQSLPEGDKLHIGIGQLWNMKKLKLHKVTQYLFTNNLHLDNKLITKYINTQYHTDKLSQMNVNFVKIKSELPIFSLHGYVSKKWKWPSSYTYTERTPDNRPHYVLKLSQFPCQLTV